MKNYISSFQNKHKKNKNKNKNCACESKSLAKGGKNQEGNNPLSSLEGTDSTTINQLSLSNFDDQGNFS